MKTFFAVLGIILLGMVTTAGAIWYTIPTVKVPYQKSQDITAIRAMLSPDSLPAYDTLEEAAMQAALRLYRCSHAYECGAPIGRRPDGKFVVGPASSNYAGDNTGIGHSVPEGWTLAADIHTHPCLPDSHAPNYFSPEDYSDNLSRKIPGFMVNLCDGKIHEYIPGVTPIDELVESVGIYTTQGKIIGTIPVDGKSQEPDTGF
ncbi:MAG TPA: hypothetical protein VMH26_18305 [Burkholderiales bacterium]|nr:hypothetical protein [Burkholderiales bacterium]